MSGIADAIKLREFTNYHPQLTVSQVGKIRAPRTGKSVNGLYVCQVGRIHPTDPSKPMEKVKVDLSWPDMSEIEPVEVGPWSPFETTYQLQFPPGVDPIDKRYTPTTHKAPLPVGAKSPPSLEKMNPLKATSTLPANHTRDWEKIAEKM